MTIWKPEGSSLYYYNFTYKGQRFYGSTGTSDKRKAQKVEDEARDEAKRKHLLAAPAAAAEAGLVPTWSECVNGYLIRAEAEGGIVNQEDDEKGFDRLTEWIGTNTPITSVNEDMVRMCIKKRAAMPKCKPGTDIPMMKDGLFRPLSVSTVNRQTWQLIRRVHEHAGKKMKVKNLEVIDWSEMARTRQEPVRTREISLEEEERILAADDGRGYADLFGFGLLAGPRWEALCSLEWPQVNFETMEVTVRNKRSAHSKADRTYSISIDSEMLKVLLAQKGKHPVSVFTFVADSNWTNPKTNVTYKAGQLYPITPAGFSSWFDRVTEKAGITDIRIHDIRRTAGGRTNRGAGLVAASKLLGHSSVTPTARHYAHHTTDEQRDAQERAHEATRRRRERMKQMMVKDETLPAESQGRTDLQGFCKVESQKEAKAL